MKHLIAGLFVIVLLTTFMACSSPRPTREVDHTKMKNKAMRHRNQATDLNNAGHQKDEIRAKTE
ncbi:MAG: hypothetical protein KDC07_03495 [Chitinophagaceae bacterium]|nr:hypothetical protein [Chitinophagaceae bacterium]